MSDTLVSLQGVTARYGGAPVSPTLTSTSARAAVRRRRRPVWGRGSPCGCGSSPASSRPPAGSVTRRPGFASGTSHARDRRLELSGHGRRVRAHGATQPPRRAMGQPRREGRRGRRARAARYRGAEQAPHPRAVRRSAAARVPRAGAAARADLLLLDEPTSGVASPCATRSSPARRPQRARRGDRDDDARPQRGRVPSSEVSRA